MDTDTKILDDIYEHLKLFVKIKVKFDGFDLSFGRKFNRYKDKQNLHIYEGILMQFLRLQKYFTLNGKV